MNLIWKRSLALLLLLSMVLGMIPASFAQEAQADTVAEAEKTPLTEGDHTTLPGGEKPATKGTASATIKGISLNTVASGGDFITYDSEAAFADLWNQESFDNRFFYFVRKGYNGSSDRYLGLVNYYRSGEDRGSMRERFLNFGNNNFNSSSAGFVNLGLYPTRFSVHLEKNPDVPNQFYISTYASSTDVPSGFSCSVDVNHENYRFWPVDQVRYFSIPGDLATGTDYLPGIEEYWSESDSERTPFYYSSKYGLVGDLGNDNQAVMRYEKSYFHIYPIVNGGSVVMDAKTMLGETVQYVNTQALHNQIITVQNWFVDYYETGIEDLYNPALFAELEALIIRAADFYNNEANGKNMTLELQAEVDQMTEALKKLLQEVQKSILSVDIPVTFYDFRSDGLMFEANGGEYYAYMMENPGNSPSKGKPFPGIKGGTLTDAGYGTKTMGLVENKLVNGQLVYKETTIEYLAWLIALGYCRNFSDSQSMANRELYRKVKEISAAAGSNTKSEAFLTALGTWDGTLAKANDGDESKAGYNGGYFNYSEVETAFDLAYYIATNIWRPVAEDDIMEQVTVTNEDETETVFDLPYSLTVEEYDYLRLIKDTTTGAYTITAYSPLVYQPADEENSVGLIYNTDLREKQPIGNGDMRFIPLGGNLHADKGQQAPWLGFDALGSEFEDNTDPAKNEGFHFSMHAYGSFVYQRSLNQYFYFLGDDDVYYFIDGKLVMDLGGGHPPCDDILYLNDVAKDLGLVDGGVYSFDMFYTERHTSESNIAFSTNIQIMDTNTLTTEQQFNAEGQELPAGTKVEVGDPITYRYGLQNTRDVPVKNLVFTDPALGVTISGNVCLLNGEVNPQVGGNEETDVSNLILYYCGKNRAPADAVEMSFAEIRTLLTDILEKPTTQNEYASFGADDAFYVTGLSADNLMELMALGLPVNCGLFVHGFRRVAKLVDQPFTSELYTSCEYEKALFGTDGSFEVQPITINGSATVSTMVRPDPVFNANKLRYVVDYGKPLEMKLDKIRECIIVPESVIYRCTPEDLTLVGITNLGTHGQVSMEAPRNLGATEGSSEIYDCSSAFGSFKRESSALYYTPGQFLENVATAYAVFRIHLTYMDPNENFSKPAQNNGVDITADYYITVSLEIIPATMMYYEAEDFLGSEITYEELVKGGTVSTTPDSMTDSSLGKGTITDPTPAQDTHYAEGKAKDYPGNHVLIDFDQDEESAQRYTDKAYYFGQEQINWDDGANWKNGTVANGEITGSVLETDRDKSMLNLPIKYATFVEAKLRATASGTVKVTLITLKHTGVVEELPLPSLNIDTANSDYWFSEDLSNNEVVKAGLNTLVGLKIEGPEGLVADYIFVGPSGLSPANQNAAPYFLEDFEDYESEDALNAVWNLKQSFTTICSNTYGNSRLELATTDRGTKSMFTEHAKLPDQCNCTDKNCYDNKNPNYLYFQRAELQVKPGTVHVPLSKTPYFEMLAKSNGTLYCYLKLSNGKEIAAVSQYYLGETSDRYVLLKADLTTLANYDAKAYVTSIRFVHISDPSESSDLSIDHIYIGQSSDSSSSGSTEIPVAPSVPSVGFGQSLLATFEQTPYWRYWKLKDHDGFKKGSEPELIADTDEAGNAIKVMHMEFDNPGSAESRFQIDGLDIGGAVNPTLDIRMKITDLFKWSGFQGYDPLSFKVELTMSDGSTVTLSRQIPEENVGKYLVHSFDLNGILTENGPKLRSLVLHFDAYTSLPQHIYLDYVYVGDSNARPGEASEAYVAEVPNVLLQMEYPAEPLDNPANWFYYPDWPVNDWGSNDVPENKKPEQPIFIKEDGIGALKFTYTSNSWRSQLEGSVSAGDGIPVRDAQYIEIRLKLSNIQGALYGSGAPALKAKLLTRNNSLNGETFDAGTVYVEGQYCVISGDWSNQAQIIQSADTLLGLRLFFEPTTNFPLDICLDYVYVGPKADAPSQSGGIRQSYEEIYGFDSTYTNDRYLSNGESLYMEGKGNRMEPTAQQYEKDPSTANGIVPATGSYSEFMFSFTGTGFDLISRTGAEQGSVRVSVYTSEQRLQENRIKAITVHNKGELELFQIPVVSIQGLPYATYYVVVGVNDTVSIPLAGLYYGNEFYFDALRIYDPIDTAANEDVLNAYKADGEAYTHVKEIRDTLLDASDFASLTLGNSMEGAMFVDTSNYITPDPSESTGETVAEADKVIVNDHLAANVSSYNKVGPKNEIYLSPGQAVAFRLQIDSVQMPTSIDIGAKSILGDRTTLSAGFVVSGNGDVLKNLNGTVVPVATSTALYYPVSLSTLPAAENVYLVIYNSSTANNKTKNILSITDLKVCYDEAPESKLAVDDDLNEPEIHPTRATHRAEGMKEPYRFLVDGRTLEAAAVYMKAHWETPITDEGVQIMHSLNLASDISINYIVAKSELEGYDSFYLECAQPQYQGNRYAGDTIHKLMPVDKGTYYYFTLDGLTATQMNDTLQATLYMTKNGTNYRSLTDTYSIARYAYTQLAKDGISEKLKTLCADLLRYGSKAQAFKGYRTDSPADWHMTQAQKACLSDIEAVTFGNHNTLTEDLAAPVIAWAGKVLVLDSRVTVRFVINAAGYKGSVEDLELRIRYQDLAGTERTAVLTGARPYGDMENTYSFSFADLTAAELRSVLNATVYAGDTQVSNTLIYSADTYGNNKTGALLDLCKALFAYADSAKAFFAS